MTLQPFKSRKGFDADQDLLINLADPRLFPNGALDGVNLQTLRRYCGVKFAARMGDLPTPTDRDPLRRPLPGQAYLVKMDLDGNTLDRVAIWDPNSQATGGIAELLVEVGAAEVANVQAEAAAGTTWTGLAFDQAGNRDAIFDLTPNADGTLSATVTTAGTGYSVGAYQQKTNAGSITQYTIRVAKLAGANPLGGWRLANIHDWIKTQQVTPDQLHGMEPGDLQTTTEVDAEELKVWDGSAWVTIVSTQQIKAWISALNLFEGTVQEDGGTVVGAMQFNGLPDLPTYAQADLAAHYYTFVGKPGYVIVAADPHGLGADLAGAILNPGDWLQVVDRAAAGATAPDLHWVHIGGDLLAKSRADHLYSLTDWVAGNYEKGALVNHAGSIWKANTAIVATDVAPDAVAAKWTRIALTAGVKNVPVDGDLPPTAPASDVYLVLNSAKAGSKPGLFSYDRAAAKWVMLGGIEGGRPLAFDGGALLASIGVPVGSVTAFAGRTVPNGWLACNGGTFDPAIYPELQAALGGTRVPDLRGQFIRGGVTPEAGFTKHHWKTGMPQDKWFTTNNQGEHAHPFFYWSGANGSGGVRGAGWAGGEVHLRVARIDSNTGKAGTHSHTVTGGGDAETVPDHVVLMYIIKATETVAVLQS